MITDIDCEKALVSLTFEDFDYYNQLSQAGVNENWFEGKEARALWGAMEELYQPPAMEVFRTGLEKVLAGRIPPQGVTRCIDYLEEAISLGVPGSYTQHYFGVLREKYQNRLEKQIIAKWGTLAENASNTTEARLTEVENYIAEIRRVSTPFELVTSEQMVEERETVYKARLEGERGEARIPYELDTLNKATAGGMRRGELTTWMAEPGCGKTALLQRECYWQATQNRAVLYVTLEMDRAHWVNRIIQQETGISAVRLENGEFAEWQDMVFNNLGRLKNTKLYLIDDPMATLSVITRAAEFVARKEGQLDVIYVDYTQLIDVPEIGEELTRIQYISRQLSALAKRHKCHVHAIARSNTEGRIHMGKSLEYDTDNRVELKFEKPKDESATSWTVVAYWHKQRYYRSHMTSKLTWNETWVRYTDAAITKVPPYQGVR